MLSKLRNFANDADAVWAWKVSHVKTIQNVYGAKTGNMSRTADVERMIILKVLKILGNLGDEKSQLSPGSRVPCNGEQMAGCFARSSASTLFWQLINENHQNPQIVHPFLSANLRAGAGSLGTIPGRVDIGSLGKVTGRKMRERWRWVRWGPQLWIWSVTEVPLVGNPKSLWTKAKCGGMIRIDPRGKQNVTATWSEVLIEGRPGTGWTPSSTSPMLRTSKATLASERLAMKHWENDFDK